MARVKERKSVRPWECSRGSRRAPQALTRDVFSRCSENVIVGFHDTLMTFVHLTYLPLTLLESHQGVFDQNVGLMLPRPQEIHAPDRRGGGHPAL